MVLASIVTGVLIRRLGYYNPFMILGICFMSVGAGLLNTLQIHTSEAKWIGYQIVYGLGSGLASQAPNLAAQTVLPKSEVATGICLMFFAQLLGGATFVSVGQNILNNQLAERLASVRGFNLDMIQNNGVTSLTNFSEPLRKTVLMAYNQSLQRVFMVGLILVCPSMLGAMAMEWRSMHKELRDKKDTQTVEG